jgi:succinoglycan biosynthesis protein ExoL
MRLCYLSHDISDSANVRNSKIFERVADHFLCVSFKKDANTSLQSASFPVKIIGTAKLADFKGRMALLLGALISMLRSKKELDFDVIVARNLDLLLLAAAFCLLTFRRPRLYYLVTDINPIMSRGGLVGAVMRSLERVLTRFTSAILVTSEGFVRAYFQPNGIRSRFIFFENKVLSPSEESRRLAQGARDRLRANAPWRIAYAGLLRCRTSLIALGELTCRGLPVQVDLYGRADFNLIPDFYDILKRYPGLRPPELYAYPDDLAVVYGGAHFAWAIDLSDPGRNSQWLLPNRIYEAAAYGACPIVLAGTEAEHWALDRQIGVVLSQLDECLDQFFSTMTKQKYDMLRDGIMKLAPERIWLESTDIERLRSDFEK